MFSNCGHCRYKGLCVHDDDMRSAKQLEKDYPFITISCRYFCSILVNAVNQLNPAPKLKQIHT